MKIFNTKKEGKVSVPRATYRFQFNQNFTFVDAIKLISYLNDLGISHIYASPIFKAHSGSVHGYDVCDCEQINPEIGTEKEFLELTSELKKHGMGLILDIVPNHMCADPVENKWWRDVLLNGQKSQYAKFFDIDWNSPADWLKGKILLPVLGDEYERVLQDGGFKLIENNALYSIECAGSNYPIKVKGKLNVDEINSNLELLRSLLEKQSYALTSWRLGNANLNYRRFFDVDTLVGIRQEDDSVFAATHKKVFEFYKKGYLDGVRVDHPDGLADPEGYLKKLRKALPDLWIVAEKILEPGENLPASWPVEGTTGYDFIFTCQNLFVDQSAEEKMSKFYQTFSDSSKNYSEVATEKKRLVLSDLFEAEVTRLVRLYVQIFQSEFQKEPELDCVKNIITELIANMPVYRAYIRAGINSTEDSKYLEADLAVVRRMFKDYPHQLFTLLEDIFHRRITSKEATEFTTRFSQTTGPAMAKGVEDTTFYCYNRFVSLNEVGGNPSQFGIDPMEANQSFEKILKLQPSTMLALSTHDTKRSEDVRARLNLLSEIPDHWSHLAAHWQQINEKHKENGLPDGNAEYFFYQNLIGAWPISIERMQAFTQKAICESKEHTKWIDHNENYEKVIRDFVAKVMSDREFIGSVEQFILSIAGLGYINSLSQTLIKLTSPGVPDTYQGSEIWNFDLVDPDNRRKVDYSRILKLVNENKNTHFDQIWSQRESGLPKIFLINKVLSLRKMHLEYFDKSAQYIPLETRGLKSNHLFAYLRGEKMAVILPRLVMKLNNDWSETKIILPEGIWKNIFTQEKYSSENCRAKDLFGVFPVALLVKE